MRAGLHIRQYVLALAIAVFCGSPAGAQNAPAMDFPNKPIRLVVPYTPGGPSDVMGRLIAQSLTGTFGQQVYVDNRPGAGSTLGGKLVIGAEPDGYTLLVATAATLAIGPALYPDAGLDPKVFVPVGLFATVPFIMIAGPKAPLGSVTDIIAYAKAHPGKLTIGVPNGAPPHMLAAWFKSLTATDILIVPYNGAAGDMTDLMAGQIDLAIETGSIVLPHLSDGTMRALATATPQRLPELPNVPTLIESGVPGYVATSWTGLAGPPGTPPAIVAKLNAALNAGLAAPDLQAKLKNLGAKGQPGTPAAFADFVATEEPKWIAMVKLSGVSTK
jgi:tripartite-type tricarboxylate transporter receptor subunit TctC